MSVSLKQIIFLASSVCIAIAVVKANASSRCGLVFNPHTENYFPNEINIVSEDGHLGVNVPMNNKSLFEAYTKGIFPWLDSGEHIGWFYPSSRAILRLDEFKLSRTNQKQVAKTNFEVTYNQHFEQVIREASKVHRTNQGSTWITKGFINAYLDFHKAGFAQSIEVWENGRLVGGLYGVKVKGVYYGESMFHIKDNASKVALVALVEQLRKEGYSWIETQQLSPLIKSSGGREVSEEEFQFKLKQTQKEFLHKNPSEQILEMVMSQTL